jgi:hypothetical protein
VVAGVVPRLSDWLGREVAAEPASVTGIDALIGLVSR